MTHSNVCIVAALLAAMSVPAGFGIASVSAEGPTPTVNSCSSGAQVKPSELTIICDNTLRVDKITWSNWDAVRASGRGIQFAVVCEPSCANGTPIYTPVAISLDSASPPQFRFTSATITSLTTGEAHSYPLAG